MNRTKFARTDHKPWRWKVYWLDNLQVWQARSYFTPRHALTTPNHQKALDYAQGMARRDGAAYVKALADQRVGAL